MFSQNNEEEIIAKFFGNKTGMFCSVGENDGTTLSNVRALALKNWSGVCVEPSPSAYAKLSQLYKNEDTVWAVNAAITSQDGPIDLYDSGTHLKQGDVALLSTTVPSEMDRWKKSGEVFTKTTVRGITFETLMKETGVSHFDFISIDAEGLDAEILGQIDLSAVGCKLLCIEFNQKKAAECAINEYCTRHGMKLLHRTYENLLYAIL